MKYECNNWDVECLGLPTYHLGTVLLQVMI